MEMTVSEASVTQPPPGGYVRAKRLPKLLMTAPRTRTIENIALAFNDAVQVMPKIDQPMSNDVLPGMDQAGQKYGEIALFLSVDFHEEVSEDVEAEIRDSLIFAAYEFFQTSDDLVRTYSGEHLGGMRAEVQSNRWHEFELYAYKYCRDAHFGYLPNVSFSDHAGHGVAEMMKFRTQVAGLPVHHDWSKVSSPQRITTLKEIVEDENTQRIMRAALAKHFPDGPLAAGKARVQYYRWTDAPEKRPADVDVYRWQCCVDEISDNVEMARSAGVDLADFHGWELSFAAYLPKVPTANPLLDMLEQSSDSIEVDRLEPERD